MDASRGVPAASTAVLERPGSLPAGLASMPPGPGLAAVLASVDRSAVTAQELPELVRARARLLAFAQAEFLLDLVEAVHGVAAEPDSTDRYVDEQLQDDAAVELGWVLRWSPSWTAAQIAVAEDLVGRLPMVFDALRAGRLDRERAFAFVDSLRFVDEQVARSIAAKLVDRAEQWTLGQLRDKLRYHIDRADPAAKRRRYRKAVTERGVWLHGNDDGTTNLTGVNLPPHRAAAAFDRLDRVARAARRDGDVRNLSQLRADAFTDLLAGVPFRLAPSIDAVTAEADAQHPVDEPRLSPPGVPRRRTRPPQPHTDWRRERGQGDGLVEPALREYPGRIDLYDYEDQCLTDEDRWWLNQLRTTMPGAADSEVPQWWATCRPAAPRPAHRPDTRPTPARPAARPSSRFLTGSTACASAGRRGLPGVHPTHRAAPGQPTTAGGDAGETGGRSRFPTGTGEASTTTGDGAPATRNTPDKRPATADLGLAGFAGPPLPGDRCVCGGRLAPRRPSSADVQLTLTTLIGLDENPALIPGLGPVPAEIARLVALDPQTAPTWRWSVFGPDGDLLHHGLTHHRPPSMSKPAHGPGRPAAGQRWCRCVRYEAAERRGVVELHLSTATLAELMANPTLAPDYQAVIADIAAQVSADARANPPSKWSEMDDHGRLRHHGHTRRHPDAAEAAFIRARDRSCRTPNCRKPALKSEIDHRIEYANGGPSHRGNCECRCKRHHGIRHRTGFTVTRRGRTTIWTTRNGRTYPVPPDKDIHLTAEDDPCAGRDVGLAGGQRPYRWDFPA